MKKFLFPFVILLIGSANALGQDAIVNQEIELETLLDSLRAAKTDASKEAWNAQFKKQLLQSLNEPTAFTYPFEKLKTVGKIDSPDRLVRIICWNVEQEDETQKYYAFVLKADERKGTHTVIELVDRSEILMARTDEVLDADNWYGALYYQIIPVEKSNKTYYTLLGWDGNNSSSNIKLIDVLYFSGNSAKLGAPMFRDGDETKRRIYMEHSEKATMSLRWDTDNSRIIFDHLSPETPTMEGFREYYVPDFSYDAYVYKGTKWQLVEDVIGINKDNETVTMKTINPRTEEIIETEIDNKWIDPTTEGSPASKEVHVAALPGEEEGVSENPDKTKPKTEPRNAMETYDAQKHKKEDVRSISFSNSGKKKPKKKK